MILDELGGRIRSQRERRGLKQNDIARALQISPQAVSKWERGENAPDISVLGDLAKLLEVSTDWLLGRFTETRDVFEATVLVCRVQGAREKSERMKPKDFAAWTNGVCFQVTEAVLRFEGVPIKYNGPGILSFFSAADHTPRAIQAALYARKIITEPLKVGICTGPIYLGAIGHPEYSRPDIMGEAVSIAKLTSDWAGDHTRSGIAACGFTMKKLGEKFSLGKKNRTQFSGISHVVEVYEIND